MRTKIEEAITRIVYLGVMIGVLWGYNHMLTIGVPNVGWKAFIIVNMVITILVMVCTTIAIISGMEIAPRKSR